MMWAKASLIGIIKSPVMCHAICGQKSVTENPQTHHIPQTFKSTLLCWPCQKVFALQRVLPCTRVHL